MILNVGAGGLVTTFRPILAALKTKFQLNAAVIDPYFGLQAVDEAIKGMIRTGSFKSKSGCIGYDGIVNRIYCKYSISFIQKNY